MNTLERSLLEKLGYDNGWERVIESDSDRVVLASARHAYGATIRPTHSNELYSIALTGEFERKELLQSIPELLASSGTPLQDLSIVLLGKVLRRCAELGASLPDAPNALYEAEVAKALDHDASLESTEGFALMKQRIGQTIYRQTLMKYWQSSCAVTGLDVPDLLRASHAKPWAECATATERLSVFNGFLLSSHLDCLFDAGYITFADDGTLVPSKYLGSTNVRILNIERPMKLRWISDQHLPFLRWHREHVFKN